MKTKKRKKKKKPGKQGDENEEESKVRACAIVHVYKHMYNWSIIVYSMITYWCMFLCLDQPKKPRTSGGSSSRKGKVDHIPEGQTCAVCNQSGDSSDMVK